MRNSEGGFAASDVDNNELFLNKIPFKDMDSLCDPSTANVTGRILEAFGLIIYNSPKVPMAAQFMGRLRSSSERAIKYLANIQEPRGDWYGRWGSNFIYATSNTLCSLKYFSGENSPTRSPIRPAIKWLKDVQNADGG